MEPCPAEEVVLSFVEDRLSPPQRTELEAHVAGCASCGALVAAVTRGWFSEGKIPASGQGAPRLAVGEAVGPYEILGLAGRGGMGEVYRARDPRLGRDVALKTLPTRFARDPERLARFQQEARASGGLSHPSTVAVFDVGAHQGVPYLVSEWVEGASLRTRLTAGCLEPGEVARIGARLASGLAAAHARGIVHRDLSPGNIFLCADGSPRILDFGLARLAPVYEADEGDTAPGALLGTAGYMAPEQILGLRVDARADIFALGALLHEMLTGRPAFGGASPVERMASTLRDEPAPLPGLLGAAVARCLARAPDARFQSASDLAFHLESLQRWTSEPALPSPSGNAPDPRSRAWLLALAGALLLVGAGATALLYRGAPASSAATAARPRYLPLTFGRGHVLSARFSPDGNTVLYGAAWDGRAAALYSTRLEHPGQTALGVDGTVVSVSSKGELGLLVQHRFLDSDFGIGTLARMSMSGGAPRAVVEKAVDADWEPGGEGLLVVREVGHRFRIERREGAVLWESGGRISRARVDPTGRRIAFLMHPNPKDDAGQVMLLEESRPPRVLSAGWESIRGLAWVLGSTGWEVWFTAAHTGADYALYAVRPSGAELVERVPGRIVLHDASRDGRLLVDRQSIRTGLWVGSTGGPERELTWADSSFVTDLSADGGTVLFAEGAAAEGPEYGAYVRGTDGAPPLRLGDGFPLALSPDGAAALVARRGPPLAVALVPTGSGVPRPVPTGPLSVVEGARFFPDGKRLLLRASAGGRPARLWVQALDGSPPRPLTAEGTAPSAVPSPDGTRIAAVTDDGRLRIWTWDGEEATTVGGRFDDQVVLGWSPDARSVLLRTWSVPVRVSRAWLDTGSVRPEFEIPSRAPRAGLVMVTTLFLAGDGKTYAYSDSERISQLYLVEGLTGVGNARRHP